MRSHNYLPQKVRDRADTIDKMQKTQYTIPPRRRVPRTQVIVLCVVSAALLMALAWFSAHYELTGRYPLSFLNTPDTILPPEMRLDEQTYEQVVDFIRSDDTNTIPFGFGFNCVDATLRIWRNAAWHGITGFPIIVQYDDPPGHMVIAFPTNNRGDVFIEPQSNLQIRLRVGQDYNGRKVRGIYVWDCTPVPLGDSPPYDPGIEPG